MNESDKNSETRTKWAEDRTVLANERTFSSWMGTGLGAIGVAIGLKAVFGATEPIWLAKAVASLFLLTAIVIFWGARHQAQKTRSRLSDNDVAAQPMRSYTVLAILMTTASLATGVLLWRI